MAKIQNYAAQARRVLFIYKELLKGRSLSTKDMVEIVGEEFEEVSLRTIQRDIRLIQEVTQIVEQERNIGEVVWKIPPRLRHSKGLVTIGTNELLSFYILKAHLKTFSGTVIEEETRKLEKKLEELAPGDAFSDESLYWDQNIGQYDYSFYDYTLRQIIDCIINKKWVNISYRSIREGAVKNYDALFRKLFTYSGYIYVGTYIPKHNNHIALALQGIESISNCNKSYTIPKFDFKLFINHRFGVYTSTPKDVVLKVDRSYAKYFVNRKWHSSQKETLDQNQNLIIKMKVPIVPDFVSWILSWHDAITVLEPVELIVRIKNKLRATMKNYE